MNVYVFGTRGFPLVQGGVEKHCENLYPRIAKRNIGIHVYRRNPYIIKSKNARYDGIEFIDLPSSRIKGFESFVHSLISAINTLFHKTDIIHIHNIGPAIFAPILRLFGKKVVMTYHSANYEHNKWNRMEQYFLKFSEWVALHFSNVIIFVNRFQMEKFDENIRKKSLYIPNGIERPTFTNDTDYLSEIGIKPRKYILAVGRIVPEKGFDVLIKAFMNTDTELKLVIAGGSDNKSDYYERLTKIADKHRIVFTGFVFDEKIHQLYSNASLFILSSYSEGFPIVLLEAMSYNLPILASDIPATHLIELPENAYFKTGDIENLKDKLSVVTKQQFKNINYNLDKYNWENIADKTIDIYKSLL